MGTPSPSPVRDSERVLAAQTKRPRILVRGVNWLGDAVMTLPALERIRERHPQAHVSLLTHQKLEELWQGHPALDSVLTFAAGETCLSVARRLRQEQFQTALLLPNSPRAALEVWLARVPERIGYGQPLRSWLLTRAVPRTGRSRMRKKSVAEIRSLLGAPAKAPEPVGQVHQIHEYLHLAGAMGADTSALAPRLKLPDTEAHRLCTAFLPEWNAVVSGRRPLLGINPGAEYGPAKRWPAENFAAVVREVSRRAEGCLWVIFGGANDCKLASVIAGLAGVDVVNLAGKTSLRELMALLQACRVLLTNDTGPMHVAAALGTPVVVPFGSTSPALTGPGLPGDPRHRLLHAPVPCAPCFRRTCPIDFRCMTGISVDSVVRAVLDGIAQPHS